jgi:hypothetical protein
MRSHPGTNDPSERRKLQRRVVSILRAAFRELAELERRMRDLREWTAAVAGESPFARSLDVALHELESTRRMLADRSSAGGRSEAFARFPVASAMGARASDVVRRLSALAARLRADCGACGRRLCALVRTARAISDAASERIACALLYILEKLVWLLRPHVKVDGSQDFPHTSGQLQLRVSAF